MHMLRIARGGGSVHETEVIVAMTDLRDPAWIDPINLGGNLVAFAQPGVARQRDRRVGVVTRKILRIGKAMLL
jgi:nitrate reductase alpha subunit